MDYLLACCIPLAICWFFQLAVYPREMLEALMFSSDDWKLTCGVWVELVSVGIVASSIGKLMS